MNRPKAIRPPFSLPLEPQINSRPAFFGPNSLGLLGSLSTNQQTLFSLNPQAPERKPARSLAPKTVSPSDSGVFSIGPHDSNDRTMLTPSGITSIQDIWSNDSKPGSGGLDLSGRLKSPSNHLGLLDAYPSTLEHGFFGATNKLADLWRAPDDQRFKDPDSFSLFSSNNQSKKPAGIQLAARPLLNNLSKLNELNRNDSDAAFEFDTNWNAPTCASSGDPDATFANPNQFGASIEQCERDCDACWTPEGHRELANVSENSINGKGPADDCNRCTELSMLDRLLNLAEAIYQANYEEVTYSEYLRALLLDGRPAVFLINMN